MLFMLFRTRFSQFTYMQQNCYSGVKQLPVGFRTGLLPLQTSLQAFQAHLQGKGSAKVKGEIIGGIASHSR